MEEREQVKRHRGKRCERKEKGQTSGPKMESKKTRRRGGLEGENEIRREERGKERQRGWKSLTRICQNRTGSTARKGEGSEAIAAVSLHYFSSFDSD